MKTHVRTHQRRLPHSNSTTTVVDHDRRIEDSPSQGVVVVRPLVSSRYDHVGKTATRIFKDGGDEVVQYHATEVVRFNSERVVLKSGGWLTNTTKTRMNQASNTFNLGYSVSQRDNKWYVSHNGREIPFEDGMILSR